MTSYLYKFLFRTQATSNSWKCILWVHWHTAMEHMFTWVMVSFLRTLTWQLQCSWSALIQIDNCSGQNKNKFILALLSYLAQHKLFRKVISQYITICFNLYKWWSVVLSEIWVNHESRVSKSCKSHYLRCLHMNFRV